MFNWPGVNFTFCAQTRKPMRSLRCDIPAKQFLRLDRRKSKWTIPNTHTHTSKSRATLRCTMLLLECGSSAVAYHHIHRVTYSI